MDKFTKTTEIDISSMSAIEEDTPKSGKWGKIVALILCLLLAVIIWVYVMETDTSIKTKTIEDVNVTSVTANGYNSTTVPSFDIEASGIFRDLVDIKKEDIRIDITETVNAETGESEYYATCTYVGKAKITVTFPDTESNEISVSASILD